MSFQRELPLSQLLLFFLRLFLLCLYKKDGLCQVEADLRSHVLSPSASQRGDAALNSPYGSAAAEVSPSAPCSGISSAASEPSEEESRKLHDCLPVTSTVKNLWRSSPCQARLFQARTGTEHHLLLLLLDAVQEAVCLHKYFRLILSRQVIKSRVSLDLSAGKAKARAVASVTLLTACLLSLHGSAIFSPSSVMLPPLKHLQVAKIEYDSQGGIPKVTPASSLPQNRHLHM